MKLNFLLKVLMLINLILLILQLFVMGTFWDFYQYPLLNLMVPVIAVINIFFFIFWIIKFKWPFLLFVFSILIGFKDWEKLYKFPNNAIPISNGIKVMSFNVRLFNSFKWIDTNSVPQSIESFINKENPDLVCLQEYSKEFSPMFKNYPHQYTAPSKKDGKNGLCILSKYPLENRARLDFENSDNSALYAEFYYKKDSIRIYNVHLESLRINLKDTLFTQEHSQKFLDRIQSVITEQELQIELFEKIDKKNKYPTIICTDLNNNAFSRVYKRLKDDRSDAFVISGDGLGTTYKLAYFPFRIDFIFVDKKFKVINFETHDLNLSDHKPISALLEWK
ncbi:MAG: endonuclease/exonuclease/phosphatase family protein [Bacteroidota bacterium]|nr:endonuclease/exonuclease/phosphatase family protein [Bacteroidota bacterium]